MSTEDLTTTTASASGDAAPAATPDAAPASSSSTESSTAGETAAEVWKELQAAGSGSPPDAPPTLSPAGAARQPDESTEDPNSLPTHGIPPDRHKAVLTRARREEREAADREWRGKVGWAEKYQPDQVQTGQNLLAFLNSDPEGFIRLVQSQMTGRPGTAQADPQPPPDIELEDGRAVYSADQLQKWHEWNARHFRAEIDKTYGPIRRREQLREMQDNSNREASQILTRARTWAMYDDLKSDMFQRMKADETLTIEDAYHASLRDVGLPGLRSKWDAERSGQLNRKANASTVQPGVPRPSTPRPDSELSTREIAQQEWNRLSAGR